MQVVVDTVSVQHLLRHLKLSKKKGKAGHSRTIETSLDKPLQHGKLTLTVDDDGGLVGEWCDTCGSEFIQVLIARWEGLGAIVPITPARTIGHPHSRTLAQLGFTDTVDRLILRIALATIDRMVVSDDSDFWDPAQPSKRGDPNACVAALCRNSFGIKIILLASLLTLL